MRLCLGSPQRTELLDSSLAEEIYISLETEEDLEKALNAECPEHESGNMNITQNDKKYIVWRICGDHLYHLWESI